MMLIYISLYGETSDARIKYILNIYSLTLWIEKYFKIYVWFIFYYIYYVMWLLGSIESEFISY